MDLPKGAHDVASSKLCTGLGVNGASQRRKLHRAARIIVRHYAGPADVLHPFDATLEQRRAFRSLAYCRRDVRGAFRRAMNLKGTKLAGPILPTDTGDA